MRIEQIDHVALNVRNLERSKRWYQDVLGLERRYQEAWGEYPIMLGAGSTCLALFLAQEPATDLAARDKTVAMRHLAFRVNQKNFQMAQTELRERGLAFEFEDHGIAHSIYFSDPDGHQLEITTYDLVPHP